MVLVQADFFYEDEFVKLKHNDGYHFIIRDIMWSKNACYPKVDFFIETIIYLP